MKNRLKCAASRTEILEGISDAKSLELLSLIAKGQGSKTKDQIGQVEYHEGSIMEECLNF